MNVLLIKVYVKLLLLEERGIKSFKKLRKTQGRTESVELNDRRVFLSNDPRINRRKTGERSKRIVFPDLSCKHWPRLSRQLRGPGV